MELSQAISTLFQADSYMRMLAEAEDDDELKRQMVIGFAKKTNNNNDHDSREGECHGVSC